MTLANLVETLQAVRPGKLITRVQLSLAWKDLKKLPLTPVHDSLDLVIQFEKLNYTIMAPAVPFTIKHVYNVPLEDREMNDFVGATCRKLMATIQQAAKTQLEK